MKTKSSKKSPKTALIVAAIFLIIIAITSAIVYYQLSRAPEANNSAAAVSSAASTAQNRSERVDADKYYKENSQRLLSVTPAQKSKKVLSEKAVAKELRLRGFGEYTATFNYDIDGSLNPKTEIDKNSDKTHPQYTFTFMAKNGDYWTLSICESSITAYPVTYNLQHGAGAGLIIAESGSITAYDSEKNAFYETVPKQSVLILKQIPSITAEALERLTAQEIEKL